MAVATFTACSSENDPANEATKGNATLSISVSSLVKSSTKAVKASTELAAATTLTGETNIKDLQILVFQNNKLAGSATVNHNALLTDSLSVSGLNTGAARFIVIANAGTITDIPTAVDGNYNVVLPTAEFSSDNLPMCSAWTDITLNAGDNYYGYSTSNTAIPAASATVQRVHDNDPLPLVRNVARVDLVGVSLDVNAAADNYTSGTATFALESVFVNHAAVKCNSLGVVDAATTYFTGLTAGDANIVLGETSQTSLVEASAITTTQTIGTKATVAAPHAYFYILPNGSKNALSGTNAYATSLVVKGSFSMNATKTGGSTEVISSKVGYYPVIIGVDGLTGGATQTSPVIKPNTIYQITLTIAGAGKTTPDGGERANLFVNCKVQDWSKVEQAVVI